MPRNWNTLVLMKQELLESLADDWSLRNRRFIPVNLPVNLYQCVE